MHRIAKAVALALATVLLASLTVCASESNSRLSDTLERIRNCQQLAQEQDVVLEYGPSFENETVAILDTDVLDTDDVVAIERFSFVSNAYAVVSCTAGGDAVARGILDSVGSSIPAGNSNSPGNAPFWNVYATDPCSTPAIEIYKNALRNGKVDVITIGFLNNLADLLADPEGNALAKENLSSVFITGGSMRGLGDTNFDATPELLEKSRFAIKELERLGIQTIFLTNDLAGGIETLPFDGKSAEAFSLMEREATPSWDIFSVWVYKNRFDNPFVEFIPTNLTIVEGGANTFEDVDVSIEARRFRILIESNKNAEPFLSCCFRVVKNASDDEIAPLI